MVRGQLRELLLDLFWCQKTGEETRQEESRGDGGEKEGTLLFGECESESFPTCVPIVWQLV